MKKLLEILGTITIAGSGILTLVANSPTSAKEQQIKLESSEVNYSQTNNLENLNRNKRQNNNYIKTEVVKVDEWDSKKFLSDLCNNVLKKLLDNDIIKSISDPDNNIRVICETKYFVINNQTQYIYFVVPFAIERDSQSVVIDLIFRSSDFYLQGFIGHPTENNQTLNVYYHFSDSTITTIPNQISRDLRFDSNYNTLIGQSDPSISWAGIQQAFNDLVNYGENPDSRGTIAVIRGSLARVILATAESMRFRQVRTNISNSNNEIFYWRRDFYNIITNWGSITQNAIDYIIQNENLNNFVSRNVILIFTSAMFNHLHSCNNNQRNRRDITPSQGICYIKNKKSYYISNAAGNYNAREINEITGSVNYIAIYLSDVGPTKANSLYFATNNGLYFMGHNSWTPSRINGINEKVNYITIAPLSGAAYAIGESGKSYYISNAAGNYNAREINEITGSVNHIAIYSSDVGPTKANSLYFATNNGLYFMGHNSWTPSRINGINEKVNYITIAPLSGAAYAIGESGKSYYISNAAGAREINEITGSVNHIAIYSSDVGPTKANSLYFATNNGLYFMGHNSWTPSRINGINEKVNYITIAPLSGAAYAIGESGKSYYISNAAGNYNAREINEITGSVNHIAIYSSDVGPTKANSLYFATNNGLYFMGHNSWTPSRINGINEKVNYITIAPLSGAAYAIGGWARRDTKQKFNNNSHDELRK